MKFIVSIIRLAFVVNSGNISYVVASTAALAKSRKGHHGEIIDIIDHEIKNLGQKISSFHEVSSSEIEQDKTKELASLDIDTNQYRIYLKDTVDEFLSNAKLLVASLVESSTFSNPSSLGERIEEHTSPPPISALENTTNDMGESMLSREASTVSTTDEINLAIQEVQGAHGKVEALVNDAIISLQRFKDQSKQDVSERQGKAMDILDQAVTKEHIAMEQIRANEQSLLRTKSRSGMNSLLLQETTWDRAGYEQDEQIFTGTSGQHARNIVGKAPLESYRLRNDSKKDLQTKSDETRTRTHIGVRDWNTTEDDSNGNDLSSLGKLLRGDPMVDSRVLLFYNIEALSDIAHDIDLMIAKLKVLHSLSSSDSSLATSIRNMQNAINLDESFESVLELATRSSALETKASVNQIQLQVMDIKRALKEDVFHAKGGKEIELMEEDTQSQIRIMTIREQIGSVRTERGINEKANLSSVLEILNSIDSILVNANSTARDVDVIIESGSVEAMSETARIRADASEERIQEQFSLEKIRIVGEETRKSLLQMIELVFQHIVEGLTYIVSEEDGRRQVVLFVGSLTLLSFLLSASKEMLSLLFLLLKRSFSMPRLVREWGHQRDPLLSAKLLDDVKLPPKEKTRIEQLCNIIKIGRKRKAPLRNILLHGNVGTGKSLAARAIANNTLLPYAILSGSDIAPLGKDGPSELRRVLSWGSTRKNGAVIIIDDCEAALGQRLRGGMKRSELLAESPEDGKKSIASNAKDALNTFLAMTGESGGNVMLILSTSNPSLLDEAVLDRCDDIIYCPIPSKEQRKEIIQKEINVRFRPMNMESSPSALEKVRKFFASHPIKFLNYSPTFDFPAAIEKLCAQDTLNFSGRDLSKIVRAIESLVFASDNCILTEEVWKKAVSQTCRSIKTKQCFKRVLQ